MSLKRLLRIALPLVLVWFVAPSWAQAQSGQLTGTVTGSADNPVSGVTVVIDELGVAELTDANGNFRLTGLPAGNYTVSFSLGDDNQTANAQIQAGQITRLDQKVGWDISYVETITVFSASRRAERITEAPAAVTVVTPQEIEQSAPTGQLPKIIEFTPGVDYTQSGLYDLNFNVRGFNSSLNRRILALIDGRDPGVPFLGAAEWAAVSFPMDDLASAELVRGPGSALYGANAFAGVLNMVTKAPRDSQGGMFRLTGGELQTRRGDFRWAGGAGEKAFFKVLGSYQKSDDFTRPRNVTLDYSRFCATPADTNCLRREAVRLPLDKVETWFGAVRFDAYVGSSSVMTLEAGTAKLEGPTFVTGIGRVQVSDAKRPWARFNFNTPHFNVLANYSKRDANDQIALASGAHLFEDSENLRGEVQGHTAFAGRKGFLVGGVAYQTQKIDTANNQGFQTLLRAGAPSLAAGRAGKRDEHQEGLFGQLEYNFTESFKTVLAARVDDSTLHDRQFSPKAAVVWSVNPNHTLRLTYNRAFQVPNYSEFFLKVPAGQPITSFAGLNAAVLAGTGVNLRLASIPIFAFGNPAMDVEKVTSYEAGYAGIFGGKAYVTLDYYQSNLENFVTDLLPGVNPEFALYNPPGALPAPLVAQIQGALALLGNNRAGLTTIDGQPTLVLSYTNSGKVDTQGVDLGVNYYLTSQWVLDFSYSWFDFEVKQKNPNDKLLPNNPDNKASAGINYAGGKLGGSLKYRWVDAFDWAAGVFVGKVPSYSVLDLSATYHITDTIGVGIDVSNLTDKEHWQSFGGDLLSRRALGYVTFSW